MKTTLRRWIFHSSTTFSTIKQRKKTEYIYIYKQEHDNLSKYNNNSYKTKYNYVIFLNIFISNIL